MAYPTLSEILGQADPVTGALSPELERLLTEAFQPEQPQQMYAPPQVTRGQRGLALASDIAAALAQAYRVPTPVEATQHLYQQQELRRYAEAENARRQAEAGTASKRERALAMLQMLQRERELQGREPAAKPNPLTAKALAGAQAGGYPDITSRVLSGDMTPEEAAVELSTRAQAEKDQAAADKAAEKAQKEADRKAAKAESDLKTGGLSPGQMRKVTAVRAAIKVKLSRLNRELTPLQNSLEFRLKVSQDPEHDPSVAAAQARVNAKLDEIQALEHDFEKAGNVAPEPAPAK